MNELTIYPIDGNNSGEITWVAEHMRETLIEVIGAEKGEDMYSLPWLVNRVQQHLDPEQIIGAVYLARSGPEIVGHTIVRIEDREERLGLFSTTYVLPSARKQNIASALLEQGESWMREQGMQWAATNTDKGNTKLQQLYLKYGYQMHSMPDNFVQLRKAL